MFGTYTAFLLTSPFVEKRLNAVQNVMRIVFACNVQMHIAVPNVAVSDATNDIFAQLLFHHIDTEDQKNVELDFVVYSVASQYWHLKNC